MGVGAVNVPFVVAAKKCFSTPGLTRDTTGSVKRSTVPLVEEANQDGSTAIK